MWKGRSFLHLSRVLLSMLVASPRSKSIFIASAQRSLNPSSYSLCGGTEKPFTIHSRSVLCPCHLVQKKKQFSKPSKHALFSASYTVRTCWRTYRLELKARHQSLAQGVSVLRFISTAERAQGKLLPSVRELSLWGVTVTQCASSRASGSRTRDRHSKYHAAGWFACLLSRQNFSM